MGTARRFCFTCERPRALEFVCRACGERECAICCDFKDRLCAACAYEIEAARSLRALLGA
jgi:hypothetical protein